jgi:hypothetical protein
MKVYIAGPITRGDLRTNIKQATDAAVLLVKAGYAPFVPQLTCYMGGDVPTVGGVDGISHGDWLATDLPWVAVADALLRLPGESVGADMEVNAALKLSIPVYYGLDDFFASPPTRGDERFQDALWQMWRLHVRKGRDYGKGKAQDRDIFANVRSSEEWGVPGWVGSLIRGCDKIKRLQSFTENGSLANEGVEDSLIDLANYAVISLVLYRETLSVKG